LNPVHLVPTEAQLVGHGLLTGDLQPLDGYAFKQGREAAVGFGPWELHCARAMLAAVAAGRLGVEDGAELASVEMPPSALRLVVVEGAGLATFRARPLKTGIVPEMHVHLALRQFQINPIH